MASSIKSLIHRQPGFTLVEAMLSIAVIIVLVVGSASANWLTTTNIKTGQFRTKANNLATESLGAVMSIKVNNFSDIYSGVFHPVHDGSKWTLVSGPETLSGLVRTITITPVMRALTCFTMVCDIVPQGGIIDPNSYNVEVRVSWTEANQPESLVINSLLTYWR